MTKREDWSNWDNIVARIVTRVDRVVQPLGELPGRVIASRKGCSAGLFFWRDQRPFWDAWIDPDALILRMGRVELQVDRPTRATA